MSNRAGWSKSANDALREYQDDGMLPSALLSAVIYRARANAEARCSQIVERRDVDRAYDQEVFGDE
jgi:hypothetical protein